jgi:methionyl-tRNA synthetase
VNDVPHIGHAYCTVVADVLARFHKLFGHDVFFLTGTDEHGQKVQQAAQKRGMEPQAHVDDMVKRWEAAWRDLNIEYDFFVRTTMPFHKKVVQDCLQELFDKGEIYSQEYEGLYSVSEEIFYTEKDLVNGKTPLGNEVQLVKEKNYFFKMSKYQERLIKHIQDNPKFIQPEFRKNEVLGFLRQPLQDLCISRPKARMSWGIELPFDSDYVTYVWFDALLNYASSVGLKQSDKKEMFERFWPSVTHLLGKDILTTHAVYWPTMLMALGISLPKSMFAHGWWLMGENQKMSKSLGNVVSPLDAKNIVGVDGLRYFLTRDIFLGNDAQFSFDLVISRVNSELANNLGNLLSRSLNLIEKYFDGKIPEPKWDAEASKALVDVARQVPQKLKADIETMSPNTAVGHVIEMLTAANKYMEERAPWKMAKDDLAGAAETLYNSVETLRIAAILLTPVMPVKMNELLKRIGWTSKADFKDALSWGLLKSGTSITKGEPLFPRVENKA